MGCPLQYGDEIIGLISLQSYETPNAYDEQDLQLLSSIANQAAIAIQSVRQFEDTQRRANREAMVNEISQKIQNAATIESAMQTAVAELGKALGIQRAVVQLKPNTGQLKDPTNGDKA